MGMTQKAATQPKKPFIAMNQHYAMVFDGKGWSEAIRGFAFDAGRFKNNTVIYDANCRKFDVIGAVKGRWSTSFWGACLVVNLFRPSETRFYDFDFIVGEPTQMTFKDLKDEILNHIVDKRFYRGTGAGGELYRKIREDLPTPQELYDSISFGGKDPF